MKTKRDIGETHRIKTICPFLGCFGVEGIVATVENGRITGIEGDPEHPISRGHTCLKCRREWEILYHPQRIKQPLLKTASGWKGISWGEAIDIAAERLGEVKAKFGPLSSTATYAGPIIPEAEALTLLLRSLGSPNEAWNMDLCGATCMIGDLVTLGDIISIYQSAQDFANSKCVLLVGTNMAHSAPAHWLDVLSAQRKGAKLIVVDPRRSETAKQADMWLQIRPGTDGALALGMLHVIINDELYDTDFVNNYCVGFDKLRNHVQQYTPQKAAQITSLSPEEIVQVARTFATNGPAAYRTNHGAFTHSNSTQAARAFAILTAITGNIDVPGGNLLPGTPPSGYSEEANLLKSTRLPREVGEQQLGAARFPLWSGPDSFMRHAHNPSVIDAIITGEPYPVKSMIVWNVNPAVTYPGGGKMMEAMSKLEFLMVMGYTPSPTSYFADLILPTTHLFEQNGTWWSIYYNSLSARPKLVDPPEGCFDAVHTLYHISEKLVQKGYIERNLIPWKNMDELIEGRFANADLSFTDLCEKGPIVVERQYRKYVQRGFRTPSGKVELYSTILERYGNEPLPVFKEPVESPVLLPRLAEKYPLCLTTRRSDNMYLSRATEHSWLRELTPYPQLQIHPSAARERGIQQGDMVIVETWKGTFQHLAEVTEDIHPEVVNGAFGWWLPEREAPESGCLETNVNAAMSYDPPHDPEVGISNVQGVMCQVRKL